MSKIEWTEKTWNPIAGCTILSPGCTNCYAMRMAGRLALMGQEKYVGTTRKSGGKSKWNGKINTDSAALAIPHQWKKPTVIFVNSMSDMFHDDVPLSFQKLVFEIMNNTPRHTYQVLTKRAENLERLAGEFKWTPNIWMGVSVENEDYTWRIDHLRRTPAAIKFLSLEPILGPLEGLNLAGIDWVIAGGESGPGARLTVPELTPIVRSVRDQCIAANVAFHFKQWGGKNKKRRGGIWTEGLGMNIQNDVHHANCFCCQCWG